ncbi:MAG: hypothetical protein AM326_05565 [Candidatus Thorarchaeota archaeon SMTZ-45]|nr:MAG: hypothetical protein AM325_03640 [Candidatus Thorarchaeota archaeon SMTZ1-45]KXH77180.1 MAG: hypothetical protein AM326_05565 [Candidatus Thorarchaeota archaeon SMTZ-45]
MQPEPMILNYSYEIACFIGQILSVLVLIALLSPLKGSTRSVIYASGSAISFLFSASVGSVIFLYYPPSPTDIIIIGWLKILGVLFGYVLFILAIFQYRRDQTKQLSMESSRIQQTSD